MKLSVHPMLWCNWLVVCASGIETQSNAPDVCEDKIDPGSLFPQSPRGQGHDVEEAKVNDGFRCLFSPTNTLDCSWSLDTLQKDAQLFVHLSICDDDRAVHYPNTSSEERVGSMSLTLREHEELYVILHFNITLHDAWTLYTSTYDMEMLEVLPPPQNIYISVRDGGLLVTWALPQSRVRVNPSCFEYQLDMGDQEKPKDLTDRLSYTEPNVDPHCTYSVRMRTRKRGVCQESSQWSDWSPVVSECCLCESRGLVFEPKTADLCIIFIYLHICIHLCIYIYVYQNQNQNQFYWPSSLHNKEFVLVKCLCAYTKCTLQHRTNKNK
ncbi:granulocyte-macrophage colony-stimulating factor receptor subunit alpha-like isoform X2 [Pseudoliparis swirei]|nr:granulocyte-macrophage colony-stimulating factor receptor subunit alpha-like isoform X2 [Pseudoliparis swirei]